MLKRFVLLGIILLLAGSCSDNPIEVPQTHQVELERQVNWAVIELNNFAAAYKLYQFDQGSVLNSIEPLYYYMYLLQNRHSDTTFTPSDYIDNLPVYRWWTFRVKLSGSEVSGFECISRENMIDGSGHFISYDMATARYSGYRIELIDPRIFPLLLEYYIDPSFFLVPGEEWDPEEYATRMTISRQVNWAAATMGAIYNAAKMYRQDYGYDPSSVEELLVLEYLEISPPVMDWWYFTLIGSMPLAEIEAISTANTAIGAGYCLLYDVELGRFKGELLEYLSPWMETILADIPIYITGQTLP